MTHRVTEVLAESGMLLKQDKVLPNVVTIVTGESLSTSWWSHPKGREIFVILKELEENPNVLTTKLLFGKDTLVHRRLWRNFLAVVFSREKWQLRGLSAAAKRLLAKLDRGDNPIQASGPVVKELQMRLLANATEIHTESGRHALVLESWSDFSRRNKCVAAASVSRAKTVLEQTALKIGAPLKALPWR